MNVRCASLENQLIWRSTLIELGHSQSRWVVHWPLLQVTRPKVRLSFAQSIPFPILNCGPSSRCILINHSFFLWPSKENLWKVILFLLLFFTFILTYHGGSLGHHRWLHNQFPPFSSVLLCPLGPGELQACPFPDVIFPPLFLSALSSSPFHCALQDGFGQTWWTATWPYHCSLRLFMIVRRSSYGPIAYWILACTSSLVTWPLYDMCSILQ